MGRMEGTCSQECKQSQQEYTGRLLSKAVYGAVKGFQEET
jgi:hypothetical protein